MKSGLHETTITQSSSSLTQASLNSRDIMEEKAVIVSGIAVYPNPGKGNFTLTINHPANEKATVQVYNMLGQLAYSKAVNLQKGNNLLNVDMKKMAAGLYTIKLKTATAFFTKRISVVE